MTARYAALIVFALVGALAAPAQAQSLARQRALDYLQGNSARHGLSQADVVDLVVTDETTSRRSGVTHVYVRQQIGGVPVVAGAMTVNVARDGRVLLASGELVAGLALRAAPQGPAISPAQAAEALAASLGLAPTEAFSTVGAKTAGTPGVYLSDGGVAREPVSVALVYADDDAGRLRLAYEVQIAERTAPHVWLGTVDAATGQVLRLEDLVIHDAFDGDDPAAVATPVVAPLVLAPAPAPAPSLAPMIPLDRASDAMGTAAYRVYPFPVIAPIYITPLPPADARTTVVDVENVTASPYGWHDTNGAAGAEYTTTRGNNAWAYVDAVSPTDAPDPGGEPDGGAALQFVFPLDLTQAPSAYRPAAVTNLFYWSNILHDIYYQYGFDAASGNFQVNGYGLGGATTDDAVRAEAQDGSGTNNANFYTPIDGGCGSLGCFPRMQMYVGTTPTPDVDGDFDNHVIAHEYTHGLTKRLSGGPTTECLRNAEQMGEGWSDWYGLMVTMDANDTRTEARGVGNYLFGQPTTGIGIRPAPYSTAFTTNNFTYQRTRTAVAPHGVGFIWATALWEATWDMIAAHGFSQDFYNADGTAGNQIMLAIVTEALKLQPCSPGFVDGRDAILAADEALYNGAHVDLLYEAFARRGLGLGASQGSVESNSDNTESFVIPEQIAPAPVTDLAAVPNGDYVRLTFTATGDDGSVGRAASYRVRRSSSPILTDAQFDAATVVPVTAVPAIAGTAESLVLEGLAFSTTYHFAVKAVDDSFNPSALSNPASATTLTAPTATVPSGPISVVTSTETTAALTITNNGPSDLRFSLALDDTTPRDTPAGPTGPAPPEVEREKGAAEPAGEPQLRGSGGPDAFGYRWIDSNEPGGPVYAFVDIAATGTAVALTDDSASPAIPLPFPFPFYGVDQTSVFIGSNGILAFGTAVTSFSNVAIPLPATPNHFIAPFWDDLNPGTGGSVKYQNMGDGRFIVQYTAVPRFGGSTGTITMQVILTQSGAITYQYQSVPTELTSASIGIENATGTDGLQVSSNAAYVQAGLAVRIASLFVETDVTAGLIPSGQSRVVTLLFDATGLAGGTYTANLTVTTNSTNAPTTVIPVTLTVGVVAADAGPLAFEGTHLLGAVYPNPAPGAARMDLAVAEAQTVRVELYDALGRRVGVVFDGPVAARTNVPVEVSSRSLASGTYVLRVVGETFTDARRLTVVR